MSFDLEDTESVEDVRYNEELGCNEYLFEDEWYEEEDLIDHLKELDLVNIESARGFVSIHELDLHFPADDYLDDAADDDDDD